MAQYLREALNLRAGEEGGGIIGAPSPGRRVLEDKKRSLRKRLRLLLSRLTGIMLYPRKLSLIITRDYSRTALKTPQEGVYSHV